MSVTEMSEHFTTMPGMRPERVESRATQTPAQTQAQLYLSLEEQAIILIFVATIGFITNIINIKTFITMGAFTDGVTSTFLFLAMSDFMMCCSIIAVSSTRILRPREAKWLLKLFLSQSDPRPTSKPGFPYQVDPAFLGITTVAVMQMFSIVSVSITVYLAVARCLCVVQPLRFRNSVTVRKTLLFVGTVFTLSLASRLPNLSQVRLFMLFDLRFNSSRLTLRLTPDREVIKDATWLSVDIVTCIGAQIILVVCIGIMLKGLRDAAKFRANACTNEFGATLSSTRETDSRSDVGNSQKTRGSRSTKETRIAKQMVFVATIFVVCNIPKIGSYLTTNIEPDFDLDGRYQYLYLSSIALAAMFDGINASLNIFVYLHYNSKFRKTILKTK